MGQTLTHGIYLPDEGERNCYNGLAANWQILDGSVGTIAAHTAALAGKAPLVHTHTKANITDLLNSNFIPSANNSYDLGSSSYQWNNLYAKNYYYNGTEFTNKFVTTDTTQTISGLKYFSSNILCKTPQTIDVSTNPAEIITGKGFQFVDNVQYWGDITPQWNTDGTFRIRIAMTNYNISGTSTGWFCPIVLDLAKDGSKVDIWSTHPNSNLGTSTNKWKTLNGVNPGALSLPDMGTTADVNYFDFISSITHLNGTDNFYTPTVDGWMTVIIAGTALSLFEDVSSENNHVQGSGISAAPVRGYCLATIPVHKNKRVKIQAAGTSVYMAQVRPCLGNV